MIFQDKEILLFITNKIQYDLQLEIILTFSSDMFCMYLLLNKLCISLLNILGMLSFFFLIHKRKGIIHHSSIYSNKNCCLLGPSPFHPSHFIGDHYLPGFFFRIFFQVRSIIHRDTFLSLTVFIPKLFISRFLPKIIPKIQNFQKKLNPKIFLKKILKIFNYKSKK